MYSRKREVAARGKRDVQSLNKPGYLIGFNDLEKCANEGVQEPLSLAKKFGRSELFGVGIFFLPMIFFPLLAFGGSEYEG